MECAKKSPIRGGWTAQPCHIGRSFLQVEKELSCNVGGIAVFVRSRTRAVTGGDEEKRIDPVVKKRVIRVGGRIGTDSTRWGEKQANKV